MSGSTSLEVVAWTEDTQAELKPYPRPAASDSAIARIPGCRRTIDKPTLHGLSGLATDGSGNVWAVAERGTKDAPDARRMAQLTKFGCWNESPKLKSAVAITSDEAGDLQLDFESLTWLGDATFAIGTEPPMDAKNPADEHRILVVKIDNRGNGTSEAHVSDSIKVSGKPVPKPNQGLEGICYAKPWLVVATEEPVEEDGTRYAELHSTKYDPAAKDPGKRTWKTTHVPLEGKNTTVSGLACRPRKGSGDRVDVIAIERHNETIRIRELVLDPGRGGNETMTLSAENVATKFDLGSKLDCEGESCPNVEGITWVDEDLVLVVDNSGTTMHELFRIHPSNPGQ